MPEVKCVINDVKNGKSFQKALDAGLFLGRKIGDKIPGGHFGLTGYELQITGGSDNAGFPMRKEIEGVVRKRPLLAKGTGFRLKRRGMFKRKTVVGNTIGSTTAQVNLKITTYGSKKVEELFGPSEKAEEKKEAS